jgi:hypothetical protein
LTNTIPIDSAQQVEDYENIKNAQKLIATGEFTPINNFLTVQRFSLTTYADRFSLESGRM